MSVFSSFFFSCAWSSIWDKIAFKTGWYKSQVSDGKTHAGKLSKVARASPPVGEFKGKGIERRSLTSCYQNCCITKIASLSNNDGDGDKNGKKAKCLYKQNDNQTTSRPFF